MRPRQIDDRQRAAEALKLRRMGYSWPEIADRLSYHDRSTAHRAATRLLNRIEGEEVEEFRDLHTARLEYLLRQTVEALDGMDQGREAGRAQLITAARGILDSLARLHGLNKPDRAEADDDSLDVPDQLDIELAELATRIKNAALDRGAELPDTPILDEMQRRGVPPAQTVRPCDDPT